MARAAEWARVALVTALVAAPVLGCKDGKDDAKAEQASTEASEAPLPEDAEAFLAELSPLPAGATGLEIRYEVRGSLAEGELTIQQAPGGYRREDWTIRWASEDPGHPVVNEGTTIITPRAVWTAQKGEPGELGERDFGALADAWLALDEAPRRAVVEAIREWHALLTEQRAAHPGERDAVLEVSCLQTRMAAQNLCLWEEAGLFLRYEGAAFEIVATSIEREAKLEPSRFEIPASARAEAETVELEGLKVDAILSALGEGSYEMMTGLLTPRVQLAALEAPPKAEAEAEAEADSAAGEAKGPNAAE
ncbi:hypothetical protein G6O69_08725 [Pseudenhygromyxa sp. WMMC2535]|uniref:hypothetical protein n=1 Tax=Pseudenhygromyxa sp. WMMC2535 TaxID=2712867 RepID=UPI001556B6D8|nr:hypothetical protein [Pseudenhygromyxa sp. WMMC2535]NVB37917.1 hypothetical protein [Pseudenhygromyxa sp. WMMC2535]